MRTSVWHAVSSFAFRVIACSATATPRWTSRSFAFMSRFEETFTVKRTISPSKASGVPASIEVTAASGLSSEPSFTKRRSVFSAARRSAAAPTGVSNKPSESTTSRRPRFAGRSKRAPASAPSRSVAERKAASPRPASHSAMNFSACSKSLRLSSRAKRNSDQVSPDFRPSTDFLISAIPRRISPGSTDSEPSNRKATWTSSLFRVKKGRHSASSRKSSASMRQTAAASFIVGGRSTSERR